MNKKIKIAVASLAMGAVLALANPTPAAATQCFDAYTYAKGYTLTYTWCEGWPWQLERVQKTIHATGATTYYWSWTTNADRA